jgi:hypothetical protein
MKCNPQRAIDMQRAREEAERERQEQEYIASLSEEEREKYLEAKNKKQEEAWEMFTSISSFLGKAGITRYY